MRVNADLREVVGAMPAACAEPFPDFRYVLRSFINDELEDIFAFRSESHLFSHRKRVPRLAG